MLTRKLSLMLLTFTLTSSSAFAANNPVPFLNQPLMPGGAVPGGPSFTLALSGAGFVSGSVVQWNGAALATTFVSGSKLMAIVPAANITKATAATITVFSPTPGGGSSNPVFFPVNAPTTSVAYSPFGGYLAAGSSNERRQAVTADFNGDGKLDVATLNGDGSVSILLGNGDGSFQPQVVLQPVPGVSIVGKGPVTVSDIAMVVGDFNGDGKLDIAVADSLSTADGGSGWFLNVFPGFGDGTFGLPIKSSVTGAGGSGAVLLAGDFNGDGILDLFATLNISNATDAVVLVGNGDGTFSAGASLFVPNASPVSATIGDFNGDGKLDVAIAYVSGSGSQGVAVALGNGNGAFAAPTTIETISGFTANNVGIAAGDFDENGILDIAFYYENCTSATGPCTGSVDLLSGVGDGTFLPPLTVANLPAATQAFVGPNLPVADLNEDNHLDLLVLNTPLLGRGDGTFIVNPVILPSAAVTVGDFNGDGLLDVLSAFPTAVSLDLRTTPDFTGYESPTMQTAIAGANTSYQIYLESLFGSENDVTLALSGLPGGATSAFIPTAVIPWGNGTTQLAVNTSSTTTPGTYALTLSGTATNGITHTATLTLVVNPASADFGGDITPTSQLIPAGQTATYIVTGEPINGFAGSVTMSASGYPPGSIVTFNPPVILGASGSSVLSITPPANAANGVYIVTITGTSGNLSHSGKRELDVNSTADFGGYVTPTANSAVPGQHVAYTANVTSVNGYTGSTTLSVSGLPPGATYRMTPSTVMGGAGTASLLVQTSASTPVGVYMPLITAQSGSDVKSHTFELDVNPPGDWVGTISQDQTIAAGSSASYTVGVSPTGGFNADVTVAVSAPSGSHLPPGSTIRFIPSNVIHGGSGSITVTISTLSGTPIGPYTLVFAGTAGGLNHVGSRSLNVTSAGDFSGTISSSQTVTAGSVASFTISIAASGGFSSDVALSVSGFGGSQLPPDSTITFMPKNVIVGGSGTAILTFTTSAATPPGTYMLLVSGTGGGIEHNFQIEVAVVSPPSSGARLSRP